MTDKQPGANGSSRDQRKYSLAERRKAALNYRLKGKTYEWIADHCSEETGVRTRSGVYKLVKTAINEITRETAHEALEMELARVDEVWQEVFKKAVSGDLWAVDRAIALMNTRARWLGFDKGVEVDNAVGVKSALIDFFAAAQQAADTIEARTLPTDGE